MSTKTDSWFPLFEFQDYAYQSFLVLPTLEEDSASPGTAVTAKKWAKGDFVCGQAFKQPFQSVDGYALTGTLSFRPGVELEVSVMGALGLGNGPATFEATGTGKEGATKGAVYSLVGWVFPEEPIINQAARVLRICGSVRAVRGPDTNPELDLSSMPLGTVGSFVIVRKGTS
jgi:hypothetical protein